MKNGLSYFDEGGEVQVPVTSAKSRTGVTPAGTTSLGPEQTESILANMQALIDKRNSPMSAFLGGLQEASAWGAGGAEGPSAALTAVRRQRQLEEADTMGMQEKMAAFRAAQAQAKADAERVGKFSAPGGTGGMQLSPEAQARFDLARNPTEKLAIINEDLKARGGERAKSEFNPASMDRKEALIRNPNNGQIELREVNAFEYRDLQAKGLIVPASEMYGVGVKPAAPVGAAPVGAAATPAVTPSGVNQFNVGNVRPVGSSTGFQQPSSYQEGLQIMDKNLEAYGKKGINTLAGVMNRWAPPSENDTPALIAAAAKRLGIKPDQPIDLSNPVQRQAIGTAIMLQEKGPSGIFVGGKQTAVAPTTTAPGIPDISKIKAEKKLIETEETAAATKRGTSGEERRVVFEADTDPTTVSESLVSAKRVQDMVKNNPTIAGVLNAPGVMPAVAKILEKGVGNFGIADIEQAIYQTLPATTRASLGERNELITYLARIELQAAKMIKGQGQITEGEREILARASSSIKDPAEAIYKKAKMLEAIARKNDEMGKLYREADPTSTRNFRQFIDKDPNIKQLNAQYRKELTDILNEKVDFSKQRNAAGSSKKIEHPKDIKAILDRNKPGASQ